MIGSLIVGALIGWLASMVAGKNHTMGCLWNTIAGLLGAFIGQRLFGSWGVQLAGIAIIPSILGAVIVIAVAALITDR
ncbi:GlsB/YeaQ/YmgE family stress response membrane protein [Streptococcus sp. zg-JUN1979]|uniref:GlsB/YeaQ/YmgE family stress response membrane protein n=1 Tax=Streptococcus sp. zg-JUN1979 TaxID=3391450 RepID=UPI0039A70C4D